jgi:protein-disulfide isomerase
MTHGNRSTARPTKDSRREAAREKARILREEQKKQERRRKVVLQGSIIAASLAVIAIVSLVIITGAAPAAAGPLNMQSNGIVIGKDFAAVRTPALEAGQDPIPTTPDASSTVVDIQLYVDYLCPYCGAFEAENGAQLATWVKSGAATVEIHPLAFLDANSQGTKYSTRAANAAACVANFDPDRFFEFNTALFTNQPEEGTPGLTDAELFDHAKSVDVKNADDIEKCITDRTFAAWTKDATDRTFHKPVPNSDVTEFTSTPTVIVNGKQYVPAGAFSKEEFAAFVLQVAGESFGGSSTPTPTQAP